MSKAAGCFTTLLHPSPGAVGAWPARRALLAMAVAVLGQGAWAQGVTSHGEVTLDVAERAAREAVRVCEASGHAVTATVVDPAGLVKVVLKGDRSTVHTRDSSYRKAYTVVTMAPVFRFETTSQFVDKLKANPSAPALASIPDILPLAGGVAIRRQGELVGALGVGGAPGGDKDEACALAGVAKVAADLEAHRVP